MAAIPPAILERVIEDSLRRSGGDRDKCRTLLAQSVTWRDGSLGCPEPGRHYTQSLVHGYWVVLEVDGKQLDYRVTRLGHFRLCRHPGQRGPLASDVI